MKICVVFVLFAIFAFSKMELRQDPELMKFDVTYNPISAEMLYYYGKAVAESQALDPSGSAQSDSAPVMPAVLGEYTLACKLGSQGASANLMLDTSNTYSWAQLSGCTNCIGSKYNEKGSIHFVDTRTSETVSYNLGPFSGSAYGTRVSDDFAFANGGYPMSLYFEGVTKVSENEKNVFASFAPHGGIGISYQSFFNTDGFVYQLRVNGKISGRVANIYLGNSKTAGSVSFGVADNNYAYTYYYIYTTYSEWAIKFYSLGYNSADPKWTNTYIAALLPHTPYIVVPQIDFATTMVKLNNKFANSCSIDAATRLVYCQTQTNLLSQFDSLYLGFDYGSQYSISPESYVTFVANTGAAGYTAILKILATTNGYVIGLGTPFLKDVHVVLDGDFHQIGFGQPISAGQMAIWIIIVVVVIGIIILGGGGFFGYRRYHSGNFCTVRITT